MFLTSVYLRYRTKTSRMKEEKKTEQENRPPLAGGGTRDSGSLIPQQVKKPNQSEKYKAERNCADPWQSMMRIQIVPAMKYTYSDSKLISPSRSTVVGIRDCGTISQAVVDRRETDQGMQR